MRGSVKERLSLAASVWGRNLIILGLSVFLARMGQGLLRGVSTNFYVDEIGLSGGQVLWLAGIREIPGLSLMFIAVIIARLPLSRRAAVALVTMGIGYGLYALAGSFSALVAVALIGSLGFHNWTPLQSTLGLALTEKARSGRVLGMLSSVGSLASLIGMGVTAALAAAMPLRLFYVFGGVAMALGGLLISRISAEIGKREENQPRLVLKRRYWLYYVLIFFEGSRMQVFGAFSTLILVQDYGLTAVQISLLLAVSGVVNLLLAPRLGHLLDLVGERIMLSASYVALALCFVGYATVHNAWFLGGMLIGINLLVTLRIGLSTYVNRIAPRDEVAPTLAAGVSINHITSVSMSLLAGTLLDLVGYEWLCWGAAAIILSSVPFALAIKLDAPQAKPELDAAC